MFYAKLFESCIEKCEKHKPLFPREDIMERKQVDGKLGLNYSVVRLKKRQKGTRVPDNTYFFSLLDISFLTKILLIRTSLYRHNCDN